MTPPTTFPNQLMEEWSRKDPILMLQRYMVENLGADEQDFVDMRKRVLDKIDTALEWALDQPFPDPATLEDDVYESA